MNATEDSVQDCRFESGNRMQLENLIANRSILHPGLLRAGSQEGGFWQKKKKRFPISTLCTMDLGFFLCTCFSGRQQGKEGFLCHFLAVTLPIRSRVRMAGIRLWHLSHCHHLSPYRTRAGLVGPCQVLGAGLLPGV